MAGCFGNSDFDRHQERQLMQHLQSEADYDLYCENVLDKLPKNIQDDEDFTLSDEVEKVLADSYLPFDATGSEYKEIADKIVAIYPVK